MGLITNQVKEENNETEFQCRQNAASTFKNSCKEEMQTTFQLYTLFKMSAHKLGTLVYHDRILDH